MASTSVTAIHDDTQQPPAAVTASDRQWRGPWVDRRPRNARQRADARAQTRGETHTKTKMGRKTYGMANQHRPPRRKPFHDADGVAAIADCQ